MEQMKPSNSPMDGLNKTEVEETLFDDLKLFEAVFREKPVKPRETFKRSKISKRSSHALPLSSLHYVAQLKDTKPQAEALWVPIPEAAPNFNDVFRDPLKADKARAFMLHLYQQRLKMERYEEHAPGLSRSTGFCPVASKNLKQLIGRDYASIIRTLEAHQIIESRRNDRGGKCYTPNKHSCVYRPLFNGRVNGSYRHEWITHNNVIKGIKKYYQRRYQAKKDRLLALEPWMATNVDLMSKLKLDVSIDDILSLEEVRTADPNKSCERFFYYFTFAQDFNHRINGYISKDDYSGRVHNQLTNLPKALRPFLKLEGEDSGLVMLDIRSAQPYMLALLFEHPRLFDLIPEFGPVKNRVVGHARASDLRQFFDDCANARFYVRFTAPRGLDEKTVKIKLLEHVFYCPASDKVKKSERITYQDLFKGWYPSVFKILNSLKRVSKETLPFVYEYSMKKKRKKDRTGKMYIAPNMIATRLEVELVLNRITKACNQIGIETVTIHDAWIMREQDQARFEKVFYDTFEELGVKPPMFSKKVLEPKHRK